MSTFHGCALVLGRKGVLLRGSSGSGKSLLGHVLVERYQRNGHFARWVCDDQVRLESRNGSLLAHAPGTTISKAEMHGLGIVDIAVEKSTRIDLLVDLADGIERMPDISSVELKANPDDAPVKLPHLQVPRNSADVSAAMICAYWDFTSP